MSILDKTKRFVKRNQEDLILIIGVILISLLCFAAGYLTAVHNQKEEIKIEYDKQQSSTFGHHG
ncbi:MAG: hypothetical protein V5A57_02640 [Candidatus Paceibacterota bacterium]